MHTEITEIIHEMSNEDYHARPEISSSFLKNVYQHSIQKAKKKKPATKALIIGSAWHMLMEEDGIQKFSEEYIVMPELDFRTKEGKDWKKQNKDIDPNILITQNEYKFLLAMRDAAIQNPEYQMLNSLYEYVDEVSIFGTFNGLDVRIRPDRAYYDNGEPKFIVDYKSCQDVFRFEYEAHNFGYPLAAIFYCHMFGIDPKNYYFFAVEKTSPHLTQMYKMSDETIAKWEPRLLTTIQRVIDYKTKGDLTHPFLTNVKYL